ncbi:class I SAM-dependent methyltransferase [candidate division KSB1 bacterium]|nr:class I SAM-dependent methyltransferase [candidate division KSB1 bacterium]
MLEKRTEFWRDPVRVQSFAEREADHRLVELVSRSELFQGKRVLDLGCGGGRNSRFLVDQGWELWAIDLSPEMVNKTRARIESWSESRRRQRIFVGPMDDLSWVKREVFHLVIALGVYHNALSEIEFLQTIRETSRVLSPGGVLLAASFAPGTILDGRVGEQIAGSRWLYTGYTMGSLCLLSAPEYDAVFAAHGLEPIQKTRTVERQIENSIRRTVNGLYQKKVV